MITDIEQWKLRPDLASWRSAGMYFAISRQAVAKFERVAGTHCFIAEFAGDDAYKATIIHSAAKERQRIAEAQTILNDARTRLDGLEAVIATF